jgi:hypothetical protein
LPDALMPSDDIVLSCAPMLFAGAAAWAKAWPMAAKVRDIPPASAGRIFPRGLKRRTIAVRLVMEVLT